MKKEEIHKGLQIMKLFIYEVELWLGCEWIQRSKERKHS